MKNDDVDWRIELIAILTCPIWLPLMAMTILAFAVVSLCYTGVLWLVEKATRWCNHPDRGLDALNPPHGLAGGVATELMLQMAEALAVGTLTEDQVAAQVPPETMKIILALVKAAKAECSEGVNPKSEIRNPQSTPLVRLGPGGRFIRDYPDVHEVRQADPEPPY